MSVRKKKLLCVIEQNLFRSGGVLVRQSAALLNETNDLKYDQNCEYFDKISSLATKKSEHFSENVQFAVVFFFQICVLFF